MTGLATAYLHFSFNQSGFFKSIDREVIGSGDVSRQEFRSVAFDVSIFGAAQKEPGVWIFEDRGCADALHHRFLTQTGEQRIRILLGNEPFESVGHARSTLLPVGRIEILWRPLRVVRREDEAV